MLDLTRLARRLTQVLRRETLEQSMDDEMRYHLECEAAERVRQGMTPAEAWRTTLRDFGGIDRHKEAARDERGIRALDDLGRDLSYARRVLRRNPAFTSAVTMTFALGIGCASAIFSLVNGILLQPLPYAEPDRLAALWERNELRNGRENVVAVANFESWRREAHSFSDMAALAPVPVTLDGAPAERMKGVQVSPRYFGMLGVRPAIGRDFTDGDERNGGADVVILSDGMWRSRYGADSAIVGRTISFDSRPYTIIGVMPAGFDPPRYGWIADQPFWMPFGPTEGNRGWGRFLHVVARLRPGVTIEQASAELRAVSARHQNDARYNKGWSALAVPLATQITGAVRRPLVAVFAAVGLLMLMATINVGSLVTTFGRSREHELQVRGAIGASRARLVRQQLSQSLLLGALGLAIGLGLAYAGTRALVAFVPPSVPRAEEIRVSLPVVVFASSAALLATLGFGFTAAWRAIGSGATGFVSAARITTRFSGGRLIAGEIAIALALTVLATLMVRTLENLRAVDMGFDMQSTVTARLSLPSARYADESAQTRFFDDVISRVRSLPGVSGATLATSRPLACCAPSTGVRDPSRDIPPESAPVADIRIVDEGYFSTMRIPVVAGAVFDRTESASGPPRVVVSATLARTIWGDEDPIGKTLAMQIYNNITPQVIGVVGDVHLVDARTAVRPGAYLYTKRFPSSERDIVIRGATDPSALIAQLRATVLQLDPGVPLGAVTTLENAVTETLASDRFTALLLGGFAVLALLLAAVGVYGVLAGDVARRRKEIGIRLALGARPSGVTMFVLRRAMRPAAIGVMAGAIAALLVARLLESQVFGVRTSDPSTFTFVAMVLLIVAAMATLVPAFRATRTSPLEAIRD